jgi:hypothetical protein
VKLSTILVPLVAEAALTPAVELARPTGAKLALLRAAEAPKRPMTDPPDAQVSVMGEAQDYLAAVPARMIATALTGATAAERTHV